MLLEAETVMVTCDKNDFAAEQPAGIFLGLLDAAVNGAVGGAVDLSLPLPPQCRAVTVMVCIGGGHRLHD